LTLFDNKGTKSYNINMKLCSMCKEYKELLEFNKNSSRKDGYQTMCRCCWKTYYKEKYYNNGKEKNRLILKNKEYKEILKNIVREKKNIPCMDCGVSYPHYVMDFDHRDSLQKVDSIANMVSKSRKIEDIKIEIEKCDVVCANCHRIRTHG